MIKLCQDLSKKLTDDKDKPIFFFCFEVVISPSLVKLALITNQ